MLQHLWASSPVDTFIPVCFGDFSPRFRDLPHFYIHICLKNILSVYDKNELPPVWLSLSVFVLFSYCVKLIIDYNVYRVL